MPLTSQFPAARQERTQRHFMEPSTMALWTGVLLALLLVVTASWRALGEYEHEAEHELALDELLSQVLQEQATQHLDTAAGVLANLAEMAGSGQATDPALQEGMAQALVSMPILRSISLLDAGGTVLAGTRRADVGRTVNLALLRPDGAPHLAQQYAMLGTWRPGRHLGDLGAGGEFARGRQQGRLARGREGGQETLHGRQDHRVGEGLEEGVGDGHALRHVDEDLPVGQGPPGRPVGPQGVTREVRAPCVAPRAVRQVQQPPRGAHVPLRSPGPVQARRPHEVALGEERPLADHPEVLDVRREADVGQREVAGQVVLAGQLLVHPGKACLQALVSRPCWSKG
mgnify:CR=1 FL=1